MTSNTDEAEEDEGTSSKRHKEDPRDQVLQDTLAAWSDSHLRHIESQRVTLDDMPDLLLDLTWGGGQTQEGLRLIIKSAST